MNNEPTFTIESKDQIIRVNLLGQWTIAKDLEYITALAEVINKTRHSPWALFVDMRNWNETGIEGTKEIHNLAEVEIIRSNQQAECWIVDDMQQANSLERFIKDAHVSFKKCMEEKPPQIG